MMNDYILLEMVPTSVGCGGAFNTIASFNIDSIGLTFENIDVKIDTGCSVSTLSLQRYKLSEGFYKRCKERDIKGNVPYMLSYGVETGGRKHNIPVGFEDKMKCTAIKFLHSASHFILKDMEITIKDIYVNYDRTSHMLIGMDILNKLDIHMGESRITGKYIMIACRKDDFSTAYLNALDEHFGLVKL